MEKNKDSGSTEKVGVHGNDIQNEEKPEASVYIEDKDEVETERTPTWAELFKEYTQTTTAHGVKYLTERSTIRRYVCIYQLTYRHKALICKLIIKYW